MKEITVSQFMTLIVTFYIITAQRQKLYLIKLWTKVFESVIKL